MRRSGPSGPSDTLLITNVLKIKPNATPEQASRIAPALAKLNPADLAERMNQARQRLKIESPKSQRSAG
ncbi:MAG: hypothetical protein ACK4FB_10405 [Brevundimonas sp.]|uniref:hypothetical protein n=1 Tax=Brevundimonas sp. TaxID=1871086 RepID=UPI00391B5247